MGEVGEISIAVAESSVKKQTIVAFQPPLSEAKPSTIDSESTVKENLNPHTETDNGGFERTVYAVGGKTFSFRGREELPIYPTLTSSRSKNLGEPPKWIKPEDWRSYEASTIATEGNESVTEHLAVTKTPLGIIEAAIELGVTDEPLTTLRDELRRGIYSELAIELTDEMIAADFIDDDGSFREIPSSNGGGLMMLRLLGDARAKEIITGKVQALRDHDSEEINKLRKEPEAEPYSLQDLISVHATRFMPKRDQNGRFIISTTQDASGHDVLRNTVHFSLNGKVEANDGGDWSNAPYIVLEPMVDMVSDNGLPQELVPVDTYWTRNPGESLVLSNATIISPDPSINEIYQVEGNIVKFKANPDIQDLRRVAGFPGERDRFAWDLNRSFGVVIPTADYELDPNELGQSWDVKTAKRALLEFLGNADGFDVGSETERGRKLIDFLTEESGSERGSLQDRMIELLEKAGATSAIKEGTDRFLATDMLAKALSDAVKRTMTARIQEFVVTDTIKRLGFEVKKGGDFTWEQGMVDESGRDKGIDARKKMEALAMSLGVSWAPHAFSHNGIVGQSLISDIGSAGGYKGDYGENEFTWTKYDSFIPPDIMAALDLKSRRALYATGLLNARSS